MTTSKEFTIASARPLPVILMADVSGSMAADGKIDALNSAVAEMQAAFAEEEDGGAEIHLAIVTFGGTAALHLPPTPAGDVQWTPMQASGRTPMGAALDIVTDLVEDRDQVPSRAYRPTIVLVSDGLPNDEWEGTAQAVAGLRTRRQGATFRPRYRRGRRPRRTAHLPRRAGGTGLRSTRSTRDPEVLPVGDHERDLPVAQRAAQSDGGRRPARPRRLRRFLRMTGTVEMYGASVRGPRNRREGLVNQDAWVRAAGTFGHLIGACDGMGSRPASDTGARAACQALRRAAGLWPGTASSADPAYLLRLVEILWRLELAPRAPAECASTCTFALREPGGHLLLAVLETDSPSSAGSMETWRLSEGETRMPSGTRPWRWERRMVSPTGGPPPIRRVTAGRWSLPPTGLETTSLPSGWIYSWTGCRPK